jgi:Lipoprotein LpqB beta-propeller domain/Sporulation and spore germination
MGSRRPPRAATAIAAFAVAFAAAGCAAVPTNGPVQTGAGPNAFSGEQVYSQPIPERPGRNWDPNQIVSGFLSASASFADDHAVAREYLDSTAQQDWQPGWAVTVVSGILTAHTVPLPKQVAGQLQQLDKVIVTGLPVATLDGSGQYQPSKGSSTESYPFSLIKNRSNGQWRIDGLPTTQLLLTQTDFEHVYQPRDLYFLTPSGRSLVPDPVFVPAQATNTELATGLVSALLQDPTGWLQDAAQTGFPPGSSRVQVRINGPDATVDLGGKAVTATSAQLTQMAAQLVWTLESGPTNIQSVQLQLNGRPTPVAGIQYQLLQDYHGWVQSQSSGSSLYYLGSDGVVRDLTGAGPQDPGSVSAIPGEAGTAAVPELSSVAVSPDRRWVAGIAKGGDAIYVGAMIRGAALRELPSPGGTVTSLSWDPQGNLWVAANGANGEVWMYPSASATPVPVPVSVSAGATVTEFRVAPDGVRAAMIVKGMLHGKPSVTVEVAAITRGGSVASVGVPLTIGSGIDPRELSWYGQDNLIVLAGSPGQVYEVPLNGGQPAPITVTGGDPVSVAATGPEYGSPDIAVGLSDGTIMVSANSSGFEPTRALGLAPVYPG